MAATLYLANDESRHPALIVALRPPPTSFISSFIVNEDSENINAASGHLFRLKKGVIAQLKRVDLLHIGTFAQKAQPTVPVYGDRRG